MLLTAWWRTSYESIWQSVTGFEVFVWTQNLHSERITFEFWHVKCDTNLTYPLTCFSAFVYDFQQGAVICALKNNKVGVHDDDFWVTYVLLWAWGGWKCTKVIELAANSASQLTVQLIGKAWKRTKIVLMYSKTSTINYILVKLLFILRNFHIQVINLLMSYVMAYWL